MPAFVLAVPFLSPSALTSIGTATAAFAATANRFGPSALNFINRSAQSLSNSMQTTFNLAARTVNSTTQALVEYGKGMLRDPVSISSYGFGRTTTGLRRGFEETFKPELNALNKSLNNVAKIVTERSAELKNVTLNGLAELERRAYQNHSL